MRFRAILNLACLMAVAAALAMAGCSETRKPTYPEGTLKWTQRESGTSRELYCVASSSSRYVIGGWDAMLTSIDGTTWDTIPRSDSLPTDYTVRGVAWSESLSRFAAVGTGFGPGPGLGPGLILASADGVDWHRINFGFSDQSSFRDVIWFDTQFVALWGDMAAPIATSTDGESWTLHPGTPDVHVIAASDTMMLATGFGEYYSSADAIDWTHVYSGNGVDALTWFGAASLWVAVGHSGFMMTSPDGMNWTTVPLVGLGHSGLMDAFATDSVCVVVGHANGPCLILESSDGQNWAVTQIDSLGWLRGVGGADGRIIAVGDNGVLLTSP